MKGKYKSFAELNKDVNKDPFATFLEMNTQEKAEYLKAHGITWGADYLGRYSKSSNSVRIEAVKNPFTGKPIEGAIQGRPSFNDGTQIVVRLKTGKIENQKSTPNNIFGFEYIGKLNQKRYIDMTVNASIATLQEENKKLKAKNESIRRKNELLETDLSEYKTQKQDLQEKTRALSAQIEQLKKEKERSDAIGEKVALDLQWGKDLLQQRLDENNKLASIIIDRHITELLHVTNINNLERILEKGIVPISMLGTRASRNDDLRYDRKPDCSSLSISRVNYWYFRRAAERKPGQTFVCIFVRPSILLDDNTKYYCHHNAATNSISYDTRRGFLTTADDFEYMFADTVVYRTMKGDQSSSRTSRYKDNWATSDQAEILYEGIISSEQFVEIAFPTEESLRSFMWLLEKYGIRGKVDPTLRF